MALSLISPSFGPGKLYIKSAANDVTEWQEVGATDALIISDEVQDTINSWAEVYQPKPIKFSFTLKPMKRKAHIRLLQSCGVLKKPRCTYKTIKRDCAIRNK